LKRSLAILIPNYNGAAFIVDAVNRFSKGFPGILIIVVDDASPDDSVTKLSSTSAKIIVREKNGGFAAAVNTGLEYLVGAGVDYVLIANSDVVVDEAKCAAIAAAINSPTLTQQTAVLGFLEESAKQNSINQGRNISGFLFALHIDTVKDVGFFDENFYMYGEEQDYFRRIEDAGFRIQQTEIRVQHLAEGSGGGKLRNSWLAIRNSLYLETKRLDLWATCKKAGVLFLIINRLYRPKGGEDPSLRRVLRPGIILGNLFLFLALNWNAVKLLQIIKHEIQSKSRTKV
jgi:GT2 family glycosyltransferase